MAGIQFIPDPPAVAAPQVQFVPDSPSMASSPQVQFIPDAPASPAEPVQQGVPGEDQSPGKGGPGGFVLDTIRGILGIPQRAIEGSQEDVKHLGESGYQLQSVAPATDAALNILPLRRTVGGVRAHPTEGAAAPQFIPDPPVSEMLPDKVIKPEHALTPETIADPLSAPPPEPVVKSAEPKVVGSFPDKGVAPANIGADGVMYVGPPNSMHFNLSLKYSDSIRKKLDLKSGDPSWKAEGFVNPDGQFMTRQEAFDWVSANEKKVKSSDNMGPGELDAQDYYEQVGESKRAGKAMTAEGPKADTVSEAQAVLNKVHPGIGETTVEINGKKISSAPTSITPAKLPEGFEVRPLGTSGYSVGKAGEPNVHYGIAATPEEAIQNFYKFHPTYAPNAPGPASAATAAFDKATGFPSEIERAGNDNAVKPPVPTPEQLNAAQSAARTIRNVFSPDTVSAAAADAAGDIRAAGGKAARDTETTRAAFDDVQKLTSKLTDAEKIELNDYIETRSKTDAKLPPELQPVADAQREAVQLRKAKIEALDSTAKAQFREDYLTHMYKDPDAALRAFTGPAKEGSARFLKERTIPTLKEAMARGLEPVTLDPLEMTQKYVETMDRFIATREVLDKWKAEGTAKNYKPGEQPAGWVEVNTRQGGQLPLYAPADVARIYNNFVSRGYHSNVEAGKIYDAVRSTSNAITSLKLGLSGFHAATMAKEAYANGISRAVAQLASGKPLKAALSVVTAPGKFIEGAVRGKQFKDVYLGKTEGTPQMRQIVDLITEGGGRGVGNRHAADYRYSAMDSYWNAYKRGSVMAEVKAAAGEATRGYGLGSIKVLAQQVGRIMQTVAKPLFEHYIPALKNGAAFDNMAAWLDANPTASHAEQVKAARKIVDAVDDRFGEMIQDNIFWNKTMKQTLQVGMLSYSWFLGTARTIGGGAIQLARNPARLSMKHPDWKPGANYALALPFVVATANAAYQYMKTGKGPESIQDLMAPQTGGQVPGVGTKQLVKERGQTPGYEKDVFGWLHSMKDEAFNKLSGAIQIPYALARNKDWKDQPIRHSGAPAVEQVQQVLKYIYEQLKPISVTKLNEGQPKGSNISRPEVMLGIKNAPSYLQDPAGSKKMDTYFSDKDWTKRQNWEKSHEKKYGGPQ